MFGNVIYYDKKKIDEYKSVINGRKNLEVEEYEIADDKGVQVDFKAIGADVKARKTYRAKVRESLLYNCDEFERMLDGRDDYFDYAQSSDYDIETMRRGFIVKLDACIRVPEEFDLLQTLEKFKPMLSSLIEEENMDKSERSVLESFFQIPNAKIPVMIDFEECLLCSKLESKNLLIEYEEMDEYEELEVTIIARIISNSDVNANKAFYDPLKDFITLNRAMRRSFDSRTEGISEIYAGRDYRTVEILAIYQ